jgi:Zn-finger protein
MKQGKGAELPSQFKGFTHAGCEYMPCHQGVKNRFNCMFCYCPLIFLQCAGPYKVFTDKMGRVRKNCSDCKLPHDGYEQSWRYIQLWLRKMEPWDGKARESASGDESQSGDTPDGVSEQRS